MSIFSKTINVFRENIIRQDAFGVDVGVTYKNKTKYKTTLGGGVTILIHLFMIAYAVYLLSEWDDERGSITNITSNENISNSVVNNTNTVTGNNTTTEVQYSNEDLQWTVSYDTKKVITSTKDASAIDDFVYPFQKGLGVAVKLSTGFDRSVAFLEFYLQTKTENDENPQYLLLNSELGTERTFPYRNWTEALEYGIDEYYGLSSNNTQLRKFSSQNVMRDLSVYISLCQNTTSGSNNSIIQQAVYGANARILFIDTYHDPGDSNEPIKTYINSDLVMYLAYRFWTEASVALTPNIFTYENGTNVEFYSIRNRYQSQSFYDSFYIGIIKLPIDALTNLYQRYPYYQPVISNRNRI